MQVIKDFECESVIIRHIETGHDGIQALVLQFGEDHIENMFWGRFRSRFEFSMSFRASGTDLLCKKSERTIYYKNGKGFPEPIFPIYIALFFITRVAIETGNELTFSDRRDSQYLMPKAKIDITRY